MTIEKYAAELDALDSSWGQTLTDHDVNPIKLNVVMAAPLGSGLDMLLPMSEMWVDCVGDSSARVLEIWNLACVYDVEIDHATNLSTTTKIYKRIDPSKKGFILVSGDNGGYDKADTLHVC